MFSPNAVRTIDIPWTYDSGRGLQDSGDLGLSLYTRGTGGHTLRLQVGEQYLFWDLKYLTRTYRVLLGAPGIRSVYTPAPPRKKVSFHSLQGHLALGVKLLTTSEPWSKLIQYSLVALEKDPMIPIEPSSGAY